MWAPSEGTEVSTIRNWSAPTDWPTVCARAGGRRRYNAVRTFLANQRRRQVLELLVELGGLERGAQSRIAEALGVHRSVISKDLKKLLPLATPCPGCGVLRPRAWWRDEATDAGG
jgi:hypothetical protein